MNQIPNINEVRPIELDYFEYWVNEASKGRNVAECWQNVQRIHDHQLQKVREDAQAEYKQFVLNVLDGVDIADGQCNTKAIRFALESRIIHSELDQDKK